MYPECSELHERGHRQSTALHELIVNKSIEHPTLSRRTLERVAVSGTIHPRR